MGLNSPQKNRVQNRVIHWWHVCHEKLDHNICHWKQYGLFLWYSLRPIIHYDVSGFVNLDDILELPIHNDIYSGRKGVFEVDFQSQRACFQEMKMAASMRQITSQIESEQSITPCVITSTDIIPLIRVHQTCGRKQTSITSSIQAVFEVWFQGFRWHLFPVPINCDKIDIKMFKIIQTQLCLSIEGTSFEATDDNSLMQLTKK